MNTTDDVCEGILDEQIEPTKPTIEKLRRSLGLWLSIPPEDEELIDFCLAVFKSHEIPGDPLWGIIIDASGAGKTELLRAFRNRDKAYFLSKLTENTLVSGYRDPTQPGKDPSLLPQLNEKVLIIKDLAPILAMRRESRNSIVADLRDAYDGFTDQGRGNVGKVAYESRFTLLSASTLAIERADTIDQELGERFIKFRSRGDGGKDKVRKAIANIGEDKPMREDIEQVISRYLDSLPTMDRMRIPPQLLEPLAEVAHFTATARSHVTRDRDGNIQYIPKPEVGTRLGKELGKLLLALTAVRGKIEPDGEDLRTVNRVAEDCLPPNRLAMIKALRNGERRMVEIEKITGLAHATTSRTPEDLRVLGIVMKIENGSPSTTWRLGTNK
jgi:hypothetical protein